MNERDSADIRPTPPKNRRTLDKKLHERTKHPLRKPCACSNNCSTLMSQRLRIDIYLNIGASAATREKTSSTINLVKQKDTKVKNSSSRQRGVSSVVSCSFSVLFVCAIIIIIVIIYLL